jgi:hypothetical protein
MDSNKLGHDLLKGLGFDVESIPESTIEGKKEADYLATYKNVCAIIEVKLKEDDPNLLTEKEETLEAGKVFEHDAKLGRNETVSGKLKKASEQLESSSDKEHDFKILLYVASGNMAKTKSDQFLDTIYGSTKILEMDKITDDPKTCYFFRNSDFYRRKSIDAAIVSYIIGNKTETRLCLNPYSSKYESIKNSDILIPFKRAIIDPIEEEKSGCAYIFDGHEERKKSNILDSDEEQKIRKFQEHFHQYNPTLIFLTNKYKTGRLIKVDFNSPELSVRC